MNTTSVVICFIEPNNSGVWSSPICTNYNHSYSHLAVYTKAMLSCPLPHKKLSCTQTRTHMHAHECTHTHSDGRRCSLLAWRNTPVSLRLLATIFTSCALGNNSVRPFLVSRWLVVGEVVFHVQTNCGNNLPSPLWESGSPVGGSVKNSIVGKCQRAFCSISD